MHAAAQEKILAALHPRGALARLSAEGALRHRRYCAGTETHPIFSFSAFDSSRLRPFFAYQPNPALLT